MPEVVDRVDAFQRRHTVVGFPLAVVYKFVDDQGAYLAAILTYYAFIAIFPILLIASSVLGFLLQGNPELQAQVLESALAQFPIVGSQLGKPEGLTGSTSAVVIGALAALYGMLGLGQAAQNTLNVAWAVPRHSRLNPVVSRLRSLLSLSATGIAVVALATLSSVVSNLEAFGVAAVIRWIGIALSVLGTGAVLALLMRYTTARRPSFRTSLPGAMVIASLWHVLQLAGSVYVRRVINEVGEMNGVFALVLGLVALLFVASVMAVFGVEVSVVLNRRLWPRALLTPFTDSVRLTEADRRAYDSYAQAQRHKGFQRVLVSFEDRPAPDPAPDPAARRRAPAGRRRGGPRPGR